MAKEDLKVDSEQPIDSILGNLMETIARKGRGFAFSAVKDADGKLNFEVKESLRPHDEWRPPADYRAHRIETTDSFIEYALRYGDQKQSLVFVAEEICALVINEMVEKGAREVVTMELPKSEDFLAWTAQLSKPMGHRELHQFLLTHEANLLDAGLLAVTSSVKVNSEVKYDSDLTDSGDKIGIVFSSTKGEDLKQFPKGFNVALPILEQDEEKDFLRAQVRLEVQMPRKAGEIVTFAFICSNWNQMLMARLKKEAEKIANALSDWTVVRGTFGTKSHEVTLMKINKGD